MDPLPPLDLEFAAVAGPAAAVADGSSATATLEAPAANSATPAAAPAAVAEDDDGFAMEAYIDTVRCTTCNECTNINNKLFAYDDKKQAFIKDIKAGTFQQLVRAAEACPVAIIHPGSPVNPKEKNLDKWVERATPFNV